MFRQTGRPLATLAILACMTSLLVPAFAAADEDGFTLVVEPAIGLADEDTVQVTLSGTPQGQGVYVRLCAQPPEGERPPSGACDGSGYWAALPAGSPELADQPLRPAEGTFSFPVRVRFEDVDCTAIQCGIHTRRDHHGGDDTSLDRFVPVYFAAGVPGGERAVARISGVDRAATAAAVSRHAFPQGAATVHVAAGGDFPDALAAGPAAAAADGPLLLVDTDTIPAATTTELERLGPERIILLGGERTVSKEVETALADHAPVTRLHGPNRFATAAAVSNHTWPDRSAEVFLATGEGFPDALAGGAAAGTVPAPVLLVTRDRAPDETMAELRRLAPNRITLLGGPHAISPQVERHVREIASTVRLAGDNRFTTAAEIARAMWPTGSRTIFVTTGAAFADALAAAPAAGTQRSPILLVTRDAAPEATLTALRQLGATTVIAVGGEGVISDQVLDRLRSG